ncbi:MAG: molybdopterin-dependent oxidoreductase [bacterium]|nr:molybdopterin-dependent oxidoreductase [bacterium]
MTANTSRREFLQISSGFLATSAIVGQVPFLGYAPNAEAAPVADKIVPTTCELCFWRCGVDAHVKDGKVFKLTGQMDHPLSNGHLCPRGTGGIGLLYDPDRLRTPLIRKTDADGTQKFVEASWEEAIALIAKKYEEMTAANEADKIVFFSHGFGSSFFNRLFAAYGILNHAHPSYAQCRGAREEAFGMTFGHAVGSPEGLDIANSEYLVLIGSHLGENMHNTAVQDFSEAVSRGCKIIAVDPRFSVAASKAERWLPIKASTDLALLRAWIRILIEEELYDHEFVKANCIGLEELRAGVRDATPEATFAITGISVEDILAVGRDLGRYGSKALVHPGRHVSWYGDDTQRSRAIAILNALLGNYRMPGGLIHQTKKFGVGTPYKFTKKEGGHHYKSRFPLASQTPANEVVDETKKGNFKSWFVYGTNLVQTLGHVDDTIEAIKALDFLVVIDVLPMEITGYADVVLPEVTYLERYDDLDDRVYRRPYVALRQPAVPPLKGLNAKPGHEIAKLLAQAWKLDPGLFPPIEEYLDNRLKTVGSSLKQMSQVGVMVKEDPDIYRKPGEQLRFNTPTGKIELSSTRLKAAGFDGVPQYTSHPENPPGYLRLIYGRAPNHTFGRTSNNRFLGELLSENELWINRITALDLGLVDQEYVFLINQEGKKSSSKVRLKLTERIRPDAVYLVHGFGHTDPRLKWAFHRGVSANEMITQLTVDPIMGSTGMKNNFVTFAR